LNTVFVDTLYLTARAYPRDPWHAAALQAAQALGSNVRVCTTTSVLTEFLASVADKGPFYRKRSVAMAKGYLTLPEVRIIHPSMDLFERGMELYEARSDKSYSLVDYISMVVMEEEGIRKVLSNDHHFEQEGFVCLIQRA
jgi:predicted nucleic acid-binding protein